MNHEMPQEHLGLLLVLRPVVRLKNEVSDQMSRNQVKEKCHSSAITSTSGGCNRVFKSSGLMLQKHEVSQRRRLTAAICGS